MKIRQMARGTSYFDTRHPKSIFLSQNWIFINRKPPTRLVYPDMIRMMPTGTKMEHSSWYWSWNFVMFRERNALNNFSEEFMKEIMCNHIKENAPQNLGARFVRFFSRVFSWRLF